MATEIISWPYLYKIFMDGQGLELATPGLQIQGAAYCVTGTRPG